MMNAMLAHQYGEPTVQSPYPYESAHGWIEATPALFDFPDIDIPWLQVGVLLFSFALGGILIYRGVSIIK